MDAASAIAGDILTYTITYQAAWLGSNDLTIRDTIPAGLSYEAGTLRLGTRALTDASGDDEGYHDPTAGVIVVTVPTADIQPQDSVSFQVHVLPVRTTTMIQNVAVASAGPSVDASNVSETLITGPDLLLEKTVQGPNPAQAGDELVYRVLLTNDGNAGLAPDAVVTDTLPVGLEVVDGGPGATVDGNVVTWAFGDIDPADQVEALLQVRVAAATILDTLAVVNVANLSLMGEPHLTASAPPVLLVAAPGDIVALDFHSETLEAQLGEPVYLKFGLENRSDYAVKDVEVKMGLPTGVAWAQSLGPVDSVRTQPGQVTLYLGTLDVGGTLEGHAAFALVSAPPGNMVITALGLGHVDRAPVSGSGAPVAAPTSGAVPAGSPAAVSHGAAPTGFDVRSAVERIFLGVRAGTPLETRAVIGKIWIDEDGNGRQDNGERGAQGVSVWTETGDVASSDSEGKLSFRNVRPGSHTFRVDRSTLPLALRVNPEGDDGFASLHLNGWASGRISFGLIPRGARLVDFQVQSEDEAAGGGLPVLRLANYQVETEDAATHAALSRARRSRRRARRSRTRRARRSRTRRARRSRTRRARRSRRCRAKRAGAGAAPGRLARGGLSGPGGLASATRRCPAGRCARRGPRDSRGPGRLYLDVLDAGGLPPAPHRDAGAGGCGPERGASVAPAPPLRRGPTDGPPSRAHQRSRGRVHRARRRCRAGQRPALRWRNG